MYQHIFLPSDFLTNTDSHQQKLLPTKTPATTPAKTPTKKHQQQTPANTPTKTSKPKKKHQKSEHMFSARPGLLLLSMVSWLSPSQLLLSCPILAVSFAAKKHFHSRAHWRPRNVLSLAILLESWQATYHLHTFDGVASSQHTDCNTRAKAKLFKSKILCLGIFSQVRPCHVDHVMCHKGP